jgi:TRAP-type C4-dicarboxylate transport system permease small subunit
MHEIVPFLLSPPGYAMLFAALTVPALARILARAGLARGWALLALIPSFGLLLVFAVLVLRRWPNGRPAAAAGRTAP